jgi:hypothetical protein
MAALFKRDPRKTPFGKQILGLQSEWDARMARATEIDEPNRVVMRGALAGAAVALGGYGTFLIRDHKGEEAVVDLGNGHQMFSPLTAIRDGLSDPDTVESVYRVVTWGLAASLALHFWRPNYEFELRECGKVFEFRDDFEGDVPLHGEPSSHPGEDETELIGRLVRGTFFNMVSVSVGQFIDPDDSWTIMAGPGWTNPFFDGRSTAVEKMNQLAPDGLPIWK